MFRHIGYLAIVVALAVGPGIRQASAQGPTIDSTLPRTPGGGASTLGGTPGTGASVLGTTPGGLFAYSLNTTSTALQLVVTPTAAAVPCDCFPQASNIGNKQSIPQIRFFMSILQQRDNGSVGLRT